MSDSALLSRATWPCRLAAQGPAAVQPRWAVGQGHVYVAAWYDHVRRIVRRLLQRGAALAPMPRHLQGQWGQLGAFRGRWDPLGALAGPVGTFGSLRT